MIASMIFLVMSVCSNGKAAWTDYQVFDTLAGAKESFDIKSQYCTNYLYSAEPKWIQEDQPKADEPKEEDKQ